MSNPDASGRGGHASKLPTPVTPANPVEHPTPTHNQQEHMNTGSGHSTVRDQTPRSLNRRRLTGQITLEHPPPAPPPPRRFAPAPARSAPALFALPQTNMRPCINRSAYPPKLFGKRAADTASDCLAPAAKKQAKTNMASEEAFACRGTPADSSSNVPATTPTGKEGPMPKPTAAEQTDSDADQRSPDTEQQTVNDSGARENARVGEDTAQSLSQDLKKMGVLLEEMQRLSAKVDSLVERFDVMESRQTGGSSQTAPASSAGTAHPELTDIEMYGRSLHW